METLRYPARYAMLALERLYRWRHGLQPVGEMLYVGSQRYRGQARVFADGTRLAPGDLVGTLHFNNERIMRLEAESARQAALRFARLMESSLRLLAQRSGTDPQLADLAAYQGLTWLRPHGSSAGFVTQPAPEGLSSRVRDYYFRLLVWVFAPAAQTRAQARAQATVYWLTRTQLRQRYAPAPADGAPDQGGRAK